MGKPPLPPKRIWASRSGEEKGPDMSPQRFDQSWFISTQVLWRAWNLMRHVRYVGYCPQVN